MYIIAYINFYIASVDTIVSPKDFKNNYLLNNDLISFIHPALVVATGLPSDSYKSAILKELLTCYTYTASNSSIKPSTDEPQAADEKVIQYYEVLAVGNKYRDMYWSEVSTENHLYCIASAMLHYCAINGITMCLESTPTLGTFKKHKELDKHFQVVYAEMKKLSFLKCTTDADKLPTEPRPEDDIWKFLAGGLTVLNFWDVAVHPILEHMLAAATGYLTSSYPILFLDLEHDFSSLHSTVFYDHGNPAFSAFYWRSKIHHLLRACFVATTKPQLRQRGKSIGERPKNLEFGASLDIRGASKKREQVCLLVAVHNGLDEKKLAQRRRELKAAVELAAVQLGVSELVIPDILCFNNDGEGKKESLRALKSKLEGMVVEQGVTKFPVSWIFLRSSLYAQASVYIEKDAMEAMAKACHIDSFEELLFTFTASGSIFYCNEIKELAKYVILSPVKFLNSLSNLFNLSFDGKRYGLITQEEATATYKDDVQFYMDVLCGTKLAIKLTPEQVDTIHLQETPLNAIYFMPSICTGKPECTCNPRALHMIVGLDVAPISTQVAFVDAVFQVFCKQGVEVKLIPSDACNITQFETKEHIRFQQVYNGDATEIVIHKSDENEESAFMQQLCELIVQSCHLVMEKRAEHHGAVKYSFAVMCNKPSSTGSCNISSVQHYLPERGAPCISCGEDGSADTYLLDKWIAAVKKVILNNTACIEHTCGQRLHVWMCLEHHYNIIIMNGFF